MAGVEEIADHILASDAGVIATVNMLDGVSEGLYDASFAGSVFHWWGQYAFQTGKSGVDVGHALGALPAFASGMMPPGFDPPSVPLRDVHIKCRRPDPITAGERRASVRDAAAMQFWAEQDALDGLADDGIDILARGGTTTYASTMAKLRPSFVRSVPIDVSNRSTLSDARKGANALMFFTRAGELLPILEARAENERADAARDALGLVHVERAVQHIAVVFESVSAEARDDRGRPTVIDSGGNTRFLAMPDGIPASDPWGRTADLARIPGQWPDVGRMRERVCGPFPHYSTAPRGVVTVEVHFLGVATVPRGDRIGHGDDKYAELLGSRWESANGRSVREGLLELLMLHAP